MNPYSPFAENAPEAHSRRLAGLTDGAKRSVRTGGLGAVSHQQARDVQGVFSKCTHIPLLAGVTT